MKTALYGRMRVGQCLSRDYYIGCYTDVLSIMSDRCNGREECTVPVPDPQLHAMTACRKDLVSYLEASYECRPEEVQPLPTGGDLNNLVIHGLYIHMFVMLNILNSYIVCFP